MRFRLDVSEGIQAELRRLPPLMKRKVRAAMDEITVNYTAGKMLERDLQGFRSYVIGALRIIYCVEKSSIQIVAVGPRKIIYQNLISELKRKLQSKVRNAEIEK